MSHIDGMAILGIRSFSPDEPSYIKFNSPLTLIVGENGCGKTTIIESMKYACTGELPPNSKGGAFVNDPRLSCQTEVKGQIKLKFSNVNGQRMVCTRSLAVTLKRNTITQKAIDSSLLRYDSVTDEAYSISSRCADMDAELPLHLGVPKAILDNVVFCHQEESNWPFSEPGVLKKKFDDIFSSKRYQTALDNIKDLRKESASEIQVGNVRLEALKADTVKAKKLRSSLTQVKQQMQAKTESLTTVELKIQNVQQEVVRLNDIFREINLTSDQVQQIINKKDFYQSTLNSIKDHVTIDNEITTEEIQNQLKQLNLTSLKKDKQEAETEKATLTSQLKTVQNALSQKHLVMGRLEATREEKTRQMKLYEEMIQKTNEKYKMNLPFNDNQKTISVLKKNLHAMQLINQKQKEKLATSQNTLAEELQMLKSQLLSIQENKKHLTGLIDQDKRQLADIERKINLYRISQFEIDSLKEKLSNFNKKRDGLLVANQESGSNQEELTKNEAELKKLDDLVSQTNDELASLSKQGDVRAKLSVKRTEFDSKQEDVNRLYNGFIRDVESLLKKTPAIEDVEKELKEYRDDKQRLLRQLIENRNSAHFELSASETKLKMVQQNLQKQQAEAAKHQKKCFDVCKDKNVLEQIQKKEESIENCKGVLNSLKGADYIYTQYVKGAEEAKCCPLCQRGFDEDSELDELKEKIAEKSASIPEKFQDLGKKLGEMSTKLKKLKSVQSNWIQLENIRKEITAIQDKEASYKIEKENAANKANKALKDQMDVDNQKIKADQLLITAGNISRILKEIQDVKLEVELIEDDLKFTGSTRTISDCQRDLEKLNDESKLIIRDMKRINQDIDNKRNQLQSIESEISQCREKLIKMENDFNYKAALEIQLKEVNQQSQQRTAEIKSIDQDVLPLKQKIQVTIADKEKNAKDIKAEEMQLSSKEQAMSRIIEQLENLNNNMERYKDSETKINQVQEEISLLETQIKQAKQEIQIANEKIYRIEKEELDLKSVERNLQDQIRYRQTEIELRKCDEELEELKEELIKYDRNTLNRELQKAKKDEGELIDRRGSIRGELVQLKDMIKRDEGGLRKDYDNVDGKYGNLYLQVKTMELASIDLEKYMKVLQAAIMKYHSLKMEDLNKIIKELWVTTYKGADIDYIAIRADNEGSSANRSFNYRVVMYQNGSELNMRGRCSAGQKVLASVIIRLALAETFCVNCGFFTLDEPTTNLDRENIASLAENLKKIIESKKHQANFQFVVITHDEDFVDLLGGTSLMETFYRIEKENGKNSCIKQQRTDQVQIGRRA